MTPKGGRGVAPKRGRGVAPKGERAGVRSKGKGTGYNFKQYFMYIVNAFQVFNFLWSVTSMLFYIEANNAVYFSGPE